jgi:hypothetical protein
MSRGAEFTIDHTAQLSAAMADLCDSDDGADVFFIVGGPSTNTVCLHSRVGRDLVWRWADAAVPFRRSRSASRLTGSSFRGAIPC